MHLTIFRYVVLQHADFLVDVDEWVLTKWYNAVRNYMIAWLKKKQLARIIAVGVPVLALVFMAHPAGAAISGAVATALADIVLAVANVVGAALAILLEVVLIPIIQYSEFINHSVVKNGWSIVRDLVNTGFIVLMLVIAFGTMFGISRINWAQQIPRLIIAAIAINFSRLITGLFIDVGQVIMIGFVNALQQIGFANFIDLLKLRDLQGFAEVGPKGKAGPIDATALFGSAIMALVMSLVALIVVILIAGILVYRVVILWVLIILSPAAFLAGAAQGILSQAGGMYSQWWGKLTAAIMIGPILTFFLWLALASVGTGITMGFKTNTELPAGGLITSIATNENLTGFIIGIALLLAGIEMATQSASTLGGAASALTGKLGGAAKAIAASPIAIGGWAAGKGVSGLRTGTGAAALAVSSRYRGVTQEGRVAKREGKEKGANADIAAGGWRAIRGRAKMKGIKAEKAKEGKIQAELDKKYEGIEDNLSLPQLQAGYKNNTGKFASEDQKARGMRYAKKMVGDEKSFADLQRNDPVMAGQMLKEVQEHQKLTGDEAGQKKTTEMIDKNIQWKYGTKGAVEKAYKGMTEKEAKAVPASAYEAMHVRQGMVESGVFRNTQPDVEATDIGVVAASTMTDPQKDSAIKEIRNRTKQARAGMSPAQLKAVDNAYTRRLDDDDEEERYTAASDALRGKDLTVPANKRANDENQMTNKLVNARNGGTVEELVKSRAIKLDDVDFNSHAADPVTQNAILDTLKEIASKDTGVPVIQSLQQAKKDAGATGDVDRYDRADDMLTELGASMAGANKSVQAVVAESAQGAFGLDASGRGFTGATPADSSRLEREFAEALAKNPTLIVSLKRDIANGGDNSAVVKAAAESTTKGSLRKMFETLGASKGTNQEGLQRESLMMFGRALKAHSTSINRVASTATKAQKDAASDMARLFDRRYKSQVDLS